MPRIPRSPKFDGSDASEFFSQVADSIESNQREAAQGEALLWQFVLGLGAIVLVLPFKVIKFIWGAFGPRRQPERDGYHD